MKKWAWAIAVLLTGCATRTENSDPKLVSLQIIDRNGFQETVSAKDRLELYEKTDFLESQPYEKVVRLFGKDREGKNRSIITSYHENGQLCQYLETRNGRANGAYKEWYPSGTLKIDAHIIEGRGDISEQSLSSWIFHGDAKAFDETGNLQACILYKYGELHGDAIYYFDTGAVKKKVPYLRGKIEGNVLYYDQKGNVIGKSKHKNGIKHGLTVYLGTQESPRYTENYREGILENATYYDFTGNVIAEVTRGDGTQAIFEKGSLCEIHECKNGVVAGLVKQFSPSGHMTATFTIKEGQKHGEETLYFEKSTQEKMVVDWYEDQIHGKVKTWYPNGNLESEREIYHNKKHGNSLAWYKNGSLMLMEEYEHDNLAKGSYFKKGSNDPVSYVEDGEGTATIFDADGHFMRRITYLKGQPIDE